MENKDMHAISDEELDTISGGADNPIDLPPIQCPLCRDVAEFTHTTYAGFGCADEFHCGNPNCGCYIYKDRNTGETNVMKKRFM